MKNIFLVLGGLFVVILAAAAVGLGYIFYVGPRLDESSKAYVDKNVPKIVEAWSEEALWNHAAPEFKKAVTREQLKKLFERFSLALGKLQRYEGSSGEANLAFLIDKGKIVTADYTTKASFERGPAVVNVRLIEHEGRWEILRFHVNSPLLLE